MRFEEFAAARLPAFAPPSTNTHRATTFATSTDESSWMPPVG